jgi:NADH dehydrogenase
MTYPADTTGTPAARRPRVVILGGGFAGLTAARTLRRAPVEITLIDRTNHHLFQPLLYQVATAALDPSDITAPIRFLLRRQENATVLLARVESVDTGRRLVHLDTGMERDGKAPPKRSLPYDFLIVATGARHAYFGHEEWEPLAPGLKSLEDAIEIRRRFLLAFEHAEMALDPDEEQEHLTFVVVGGGPTGVELAGVLPQIARRTLRRDFRHIDPARARVLLLEGGERVLPAFPPEISARARRDLEALGVEVRTRCLVTRIEPDAVYAGEERIPARTVFWGAGNQASPLGRTLGVPVDRAGRVPVEDDLSIPGHPRCSWWGTLPP